MLNPPFFLDSALESRYPTAYGVGISVCQHGDRNITTSNDYFKRYIFLPTFFFKNDFNLLFYIELSVPVVAIGTINEMLYKNCVPAEFENFVVLLFNNSCIILHHLVHNSNNGHLPQQTRPQYVRMISIFLLIVFKNLFL